ncbi:MAG TPA: hypothetical protein VI756_09425 [Blastocatellia bacterium]
MSGQILEGAWEEILDHASELSGKRVRLVVLDEQSKTERPLQDATAGIAGSIDSTDGSGQGFPPTPLTDTLAGKFKAQGLKIP